MFNTTKNMIQIVAGGLLLAGFTGCAQSQKTSAGAWQWSPPARLAAGNSGSSGTVIASPVQNDAQYFAYAPGQSPEFDRRDGQMSIRSTDPTSGWMGWPEEQRPTLDYYRSFRTGRNADQYVYPNSGPNPRPVYRRSRSSYRRPNARPYRRSNNVNRYH